MQLPTGLWHDGLNLIKPLKAGVPTRRSVSAMKPACSLSPCSGCPDRIVCRCFGVKESTIGQAIATPGLRTVKEICKHTEAGDGCTCCHADLRRLLDEHAAV